MPALPERGAVAVFISFEVLHHHFGCLGKHKVGAANPDTRVADDVVGALEIQKRRNLIRLDFEPQEVSVRASTQKAL